MFLATKTSRGWVFAWAALVGLALLVALAVIAGTAAAQTPADASPFPQRIAEQEPIPTRSLWDMLRAGGPLLIPIVVCSFVLCVFVLERSVSLRRGNVIPGPFVKRFLHQLQEEQIDQDEALARCEENGSQIAKVFAGAVRKWGRPAVEVEQAIIDAGERATNHLRRYLRVINGVATVSPLLGLLGTVWGMMEAFNAIATADAMGRPELLAGGISQALLTTAAGLFVAIPALIAYLFFIGRVDRHVIEMDALGQQLVDLISAEALSGERRERRSKKSKAA
jgi:biopolymer transport protein ExbB